MHTLEDLRESVLRGPPFRAFEAVTANFSLPKPLVMRVLRVPARTLVRRRRSARFLADESDRLLRLARIPALTEEVLGGRDQAGRWLQKPNRGLGGAVPLERLDTELASLSRARQKNRRMTPDSAHEIAEAMRSGVSRAFLFR